MRPDNLSSSDSDEYLEYSEESLEVCEMEKVVEPALQNINHIFVCSAGSVASGSLYHTFQHKFPKVEHVHQIKTIKEQIDMCEKRNDYTLFLMGVRDPIVRNISFFMQRCDQKERRVFYDNGKCDRNGYVGTQNYVNTLSGDELAAIFKERNYDMSSLEWFRMAAFVFGIRANEKFDWGKGYTLYKRPKYVLIIYRLESISRLEEYLRENLCVDEENKRIDKLLKINTWDSKWYKDKYDELMKSIRFTEEEVNRVYDTEVVRYLYSPEEIQAMKDRWLSLNVVEEVPIEETTNDVSLEVPIEEVSLEVQVEDSTPTTQVEDSVSLEAQVDDEVVEAQVDDDVSLETRVEVGESTSVEEQVPTEEEVPTTKQEVPAKASVKKPARKKAPAKRKKRNVQ